MNNSSKNRSHTQLMSMTSPSQGILEGQALPDYFAVSDALEQSGLHLALPDGLEEKYRTHYQQSFIELFKKCTPHILALYFILNIAVAGFSIVYQTPAWIFSVVVADLGMLVPLLLSRIQSQKHNFQRYAAVGMALSLCALLAAPFLVPTGPAKIMAQMIGLYGYLFFYGFSRLSFKSIFITGWVSGTLVYTTGAIVYDVIPWLEYGYTVIAGNVLGGILFLVLAQYQRTAYLQRSLLEHEQNKVVKLDRELKIISRLDALTKLSNQCYATDVLNREWGHCERHGLQLSLMLVNIDEFRGFNKAYGRSKADQALCAVASVIRDQRREEAHVAARWSGDEFLLLMPRVGKEALSFAAERCINQVRKLDIAHNHSSCATRVTVSIGAVSCFPHRGGTPEAFIKKAEVALNYAKSEGKNSWFVLDD